MFMKDIRIGQRVYDPTIDAHYIWVAGHYTTPRNEPVEVLCTNCGFPGSVFLKWADTEQNVNFCVDCADIESLQIVMVLVK